MRILALPAYRNRRQNPYNSLLYGSLATSGHEITEMSLGAAVAIRADVVHVHWPEAALNKTRRAAAVVRSIEVLLAVVIAKCRGARVVWTVHNTRSHGQRYPLLERLFWRAFLPLVDGWVALTAASVVPATDAHGRLAHLPHAVVAHGHYRAAYPRPPAKDIARHRVDLPAASPVLLALGRVKPYKGIDRLVAVFRELLDPRARLVVAGRCDDPRLAAELIAAAALDDRVRLDLRDLSEEEIALWVGAADLVVLPYRAILNSGSAVLALSLDRPVLGPHAGSFTELAAACPEWVATYDDLTADVLESALRRARTPRGVPDLSSYEWDLLARQTEALYDEVVRHQRRKCSRSS